MIRRPPRSTLDRASAASDVYKRQVRPRAVGLTPNHDEPPRLERIVAQQVGGAMGQQTGLRLTVDRRVGVDR